jgi:hypothetical protein
MEVNMAYFDLLYMRSYKTAGPSREQLYFVKGQPVQVSDVDINYYKAQPEIFIQVDEKGERVVQEVVVTENRTYKRFREQNILPEDAEEL